MEWFALLIPILSIPIVRMLFPHRVVWWEFLLPMVPCFILIILFKCVIEGCQVRDTERYGAWVQEVCYYEDWNEWIQQTCSTTDDKGNTTTYDCSYSQYHPEYWECLTSGGETLRINHDEYKTIRKKLGNSKFVDMHRWYYTNDGDCYKSVWDQSESHLVPVFTSHKYTNRVQASDSVFSYPEVEDKEGLYDFPPLSDYFNDPAILGKHPQKWEANRLLEKYNAKMGQQYEIRYWILLFEGQSRNRGYDQESYWKGGNKNEFVICIGLDKGKVKWCHPFCWSPDGYGGNDVLRVRVRDYVESRKKLNLIDLVEYVIKDSKKLWRRKQFSEFNYLDVELPNWAQFLIYTSVLLATCGTSLYSVNNEFNES